MISVWELTSLGEIATIFDGPHATPKKTSQGPWYLSISSLNGGRLDLSASAHLSEDDFPKWTKRVRPIPGDTLFSYETRLGDAAHWYTNEPAALGRRMGLLRPKKNVDPRFLTYAYLSPQFQMEIHKHSIQGATVDRLPIGTMSKWPIAIPPYAEQRKIAEVLGSLDDLISLNEDVSKTLGEVSSTVGELFLEGSTDKVTLEEVADHLPGKYINREEYSSYGKFAVYGSNNIMGFHSKFLYPGPLSILARIGSNCGNLMLSSNSAWVNNNASAIKAKRANTAYWLHQLLTRIDMSMYRTGTGQPFIQIRDLMSSHVPWIDPKSLASANNILEILALASDAISRERVSLVKTRDELLPLLFSGVVRVKDVAA